MPFPVLDGQNEQLADRQDYDAIELVQKFADPQSFDIVCVHTAAHQVNRPVNINQFDCPKVLFAGDSHHLDKHPVHSLLQYAEAQQFDAVISLFNRDHLRWFGQITNLKRGWFPAISIEHVPYPIQLKRTPSILFLGNNRGNHPRRKVLIERMEADKLPVVHTMRTRQASAKYYATNLICFNASLNGDLNMRVYEILSAGGFLLTDKISMDNGLDLLLEDGREYVSYNNYIDLRDKARYYLAHPEEAIAIAQRGHRKFLETMLPSLVAKDFFQWILGSGAPQFDYQFLPKSIESINISRRLEIFEELQRLHMYREKLKILALGERSTLVLDDFTGLSRASLWSLSTLSAKCSDNIQTRNLQSVKSMKWPIVIVDQKNKAMLSEFSQEPEKVFII
jgi:hypothetical protein